MALLAELISPMSTGEPVTAAESRGVGAGLGWGQDSSPSRATTFITSICWAPPVFQASGWQTLKMVT